MVTPSVGQHTHEVDQLVGAACERAGLADFGVDGWRDELEVLVESVESAAGVNDGGHDENQQELRTSNRPEHGPHLSTARKSLISFLVRTRSSPYNSAEQMEVE